LTEAARSSQGKCIVPDEGAVNLLVVQHVAGDTGGNVIGLLAAAGANLTSVLMERGDAFPPVDTFDIILVLGGPMDVWDIDHHPWLVEEKRAIRRFVRELGRPYLGLCLGHQLLADALGGTCGPQRPKQIGPFSIELTAEGRRAPIFSGFEPVFPAYKWHGVRVAQLPDDGMRLAQSDQCRCEAMQIGANAFGVQFHPEFCESTHREWHSIPGSPEAYIQRFGEKAREAAEIESAPFLADYEANASRLCRNFMEIARNGRVS
jgi:GMP synthase-like glutamine amidotransferase